MKTKEELDALKQEVEALNVKLTALSDDELAQVAAGLFPFPRPPRTPKPGGSPSSAAGDSICVPFP